MRPARWRRRRTPRRAAAASRSRRWSPARRPAASHSMRFTCWHEGVLDAQRCVIQDLGPARPQQHTSEWAAVPPRTHGGPWLAALPPAKALKITCSRAALLCDCDLCSRTNRSDAAAACMSRRCAPARRPGAFKPFEHCKRGRTDDHGAVTKRSVIDRTALLLTQQYSQDGACH